MLPSGVGQLTLLMPLVCRWATRVFTSPSEAYLWRGKMNTSGGCSEDDDGDDEVDEATQDALPSLAPATRRHPINRGGGVDNPQSFLLLLLKFIKRLISG